MGGMKLRLSAARIKPRSSRTQGQETASQRGGEDIKGVIIQIGDRLGSLDPQNVLACEDDEGRER